MSTGSVHLSGSSDGGRLLGRLLLAGPPAPSCELFPMWKREQRQTECHLSAGIRARPFPTTFSPSPHLRQERKELTWYRQRSRGPKQFDTCIVMGAGAEPGCWLHRHPQTRSATSKIQAGGKRLRPTCTERLWLWHWPQGFCYRTASGREAVTTHSPTWWLLFPHYEGRSQDFHWRSSSSNKWRGNYLIFINEYWEVHLNLECL